jgi:hypothetical protein
MTKKVDSDNAKTKCFEALADLEEFLSSEVMINKYQMRAEQRVLDKFSELNNDTHWRVLETIDDFVRDQLTDYQAFNEVFTDITKQQQRVSTLKAALEQKTDLFITKEKKAAS